MEDIRRAVSMFFKSAGDAIYVVGLTKEEMGGSEFFRLLARQGGTPASYGGRVPGLDTASALITYRAMNEAHARGLLRSSHTPTLGGLAIAFVLPAIGGDLGAEIDISSLMCDGAMDDDAKLFSESNSRFVVTCAPGNAAALEAIFHDVPIARVGTVSGEKRVLVTGEGGRRLVDIDINALRRAFKDPLYDV
jgi:phosphoribosylformylglycinamidine synthase